MFRDISQWPEYTNPHEALVAETSNWGPRLDTAMYRYDQLQGELPATLSKLAIGIVDGDEHRNNFAMGKIHNRWQAEPGSFGALLLVNYLGEKPSRRTRKLVDTIHEQFDAVAVPAAVALVGYESRRVDDLRDDAWGIGVSHALHHDVKYPIIGISQDADIVATSPDCFSNLTSNEHVTAPATLWSTKTVENLPGDPNLPLNLLVKYWRAARDSWWEHAGASAIPPGASMAMRLDTYAIARTWGGDPSPHNTTGAGETVRLLRNIRARASGQIDTTRDGIPSIQDHAKRVDGWVEVSGRRELMRLVGIFLRDGKATVDPFTTSGGRASYRRYTYGRLGFWAKVGSAKVSPANLKNVLDNLIDVPMLSACLDESQRQQVRADLQALREKFDLSLSSTNPAD